MNDEKDFYEGFTLILGVFIGALVAGGLSFGVGLLDSSSAMTSGDAAAIAAVNERIRPVARIALLGDAELAAAAAAISTPAPVEATLSGPQVFNEACYLCHAPPGVPGAPVVGDGAAWEARIAQGLAVLEDHAVNGYQGEVGFMPPKGGRVDLTDEEVLSAVDYMLEQIGQ